MAASTPAAPNAQSETAESNAIPFHDRLVLWMFVLGIIMFALLLLGDMFINFLQ
jgi:hypothetical protein